MESNIKKGVSFGEEGAWEGALAPNGGSASSASVFDGDTVHLNGDWTLDTGTLKKACKVDDEDFNGNGNKVDNAHDGNGNGNSRWCMTESGTALASDIFNGEIAWVDGVAVTDTQKTGFLVRIFI